MSRRWRVWLWKSVEWQVWRALAISGIFREIVKPRSVAGIGRRGSPAGSALRRRPSAEWNWFLFFVLNAALKGPLFHGDVGCKSRPRKWLRSVCPYIFRLPNFYHGGTESRRSLYLAFLPLRFSRNWQHAEPGPMRRLEGVHVALNLLCQQCVGISVNGVTEQSDGKHRVRSCDYGPFRTKSRCSCQKFLPNHVERNVAV